MQHPTTAEIMERFNHAFLAHDPAGFADLIADDCVMEAIEPAPDGARYEGRDACVGFWLALVNDRQTQFELEAVTAADETATIRWRLRFGQGARDYVRGVNLMRVSDGKIVEALGYSKTPGGGGSPLADVVS